MTLVPDSATLLLGSKTFATYGPPVSASLPDLVARLWEQQRQTWPALADGLAALQAARTRELTWDGIRFKLQFNPRRIVSNQARVDKESVANRACFLCVERLPALQQGILYRRDYLILCNPAPIFPQHFTVAHRSHLPQAFEPSMGLFLTLARDLQPGHIVFYNGPACGASAPDHLHFQICPAGIMPLEHELGNSSRRALSRTWDDVSVSAVIGLMRGAILLEGQEVPAVEQMLHRCLDALSDATSSVGEPLVNVMARVQDDRWQVVLIPRKAHRPSCYFRPPSERILISPGTVDMGGLVITPAEKDFLRVDVETLRSIFHEVSFDDAMVKEMVAAL